MPARVPWGVQGPARPTGWRWSPTSRWMRRATARSSRVRALPSRGANATATQSQRRSMAGWRPATAASSAILPRTAPQHRSRRSSRRCSSPSATPIRCGRTPSSCSSGSAPRASSPRRLSSPTTTSPPLGHKYQLDLDMSEGRRFWNVCSRSWSNVHEHRRQGHGPVHLMGQAKGLIADDAGGGLNNSGSSGIYAVQALLQIPAATRDRNSAPRGDGLSTHHDESISAASASAKMSRSGPAGSPHRLTACKSVWQISGKRQLPAPRHTTGWARTPLELLVWCGAPRRNRTGDPILTINLALTAVPTSVCAGRRRP
jgi:hypothetical protein